MDPVTGAREMLAALCSSLAPSQVRPIVKVCLAAVQRLGVRLLTVSSYLPFSAAVSMVEWWGCETAGDNNTVSKQNTALYGATDRNIFQSLLETIWGPWYLYRGLHSVEVVTGSLCPV